MARPTLLTHPKFSRLAGALRSRRNAIGTLELLWEASYASGDDVIGDAATVEAIVEWDGPPGALVALLVAGVRPGGAGFLDVIECEGGPVYAVHDLDDHAPDYVAKRRQRELARRSKGETIRSARQAAGRARHQEPDVGQQTATGVQQTADTDQQAAANGGHLLANGGHVPANGAPPFSLLPSPAPSPKDPDLPPPPRARSVDALAPPRAPHRPYPLGAATLAFLAVYDLYPRKDAKAKAAAVFQELAEAHPRGEDGLSAEVVAWMKSGRLNEHPYRGEARFRPLLETVLAEQRWLEPASAPDDAPPAKNTGPPRGILAREAARDEELRQVVARHQEEERQRSATRGKQP